MEATQSTSNSKTNNNFLIFNYFQQKNNLGWTAGTLLIAIVISIPVLTILSSIFMPSSEIWQHLKSTVLSEYVIYSLLLVVGVSIGTLLIGITTAWLCTDRQKGEPI